MDAYYCPGNTGDLLVFKRSIYKHYAVNIGDGEIVHLTSDLDNDLTGFVRGLSIDCCSSTQEGNAVVKREPYILFKKSGDRVTVEDDWKGKTALQRFEIVRRALSRVGRRGYNLLFKNCEHFARWCRYGEETSDQAINFGIGLGVAAGAVLLGLGLGAYCLSSDSEAEKKRKQRNRRQ
ncbi:phospholipase A and acyltransferase 2-like [Actinia tenebrosa]|uniref:Phospholipase A and acyltransferase 2-like n=1 Tax=Actinia tenebrosa TaxID=6105 RepID=A0A6P8HWR6_ACTTE|nr:phospholipase A and acyltransferase 2-like [Actinia tenebrosa]